MKVRENLLTFSSSLPGPGRGSRNNNNILTDFNYADPKPAQYGRALHCLSFVYNFAEKLYLILARPIKSFDSNDLTYGGITCKNRFGVHFGHTGPHRPPM